MVNPIFLGHPRNGLTPVMPNNYFALFFLQRWHLCCSDFTFLLIGNLFYRIECLAIDKTKLLLCREMMAPFERQFNAFYAGVIDLELEISVFLRTKRHNAIC